METNDDKAPGYSIGELSIVDTFTKLIFGQEVEYSPQELQIISALRLADSNVSLDNHRDMGTYLRAMGVKEMIQLVAEVRSLLAGGFLDPRASGPNLESAPTNLGRTS